MEEACNGEAEGMHPLLVFHCNFPTKGKEQLCNRPLEDAWVTACSHIFCYSHAKEWFQTNNDCPVCRSGRVNVLRVNLSQASVTRRGRMALLGMTPTEVMQATQTALSFWVDQKVYEFVAMGHRQKQLADQQKAAEEHIKSKLQEAEDQCNAMEAEQQQINKKIDVAEKEKLKVSEELERLRCEVAAAEDRHSRLQRQVVGEQRQDLFRRPLLEEPSPSTALAPDSVAGRRTSRTIPDSVPRNTPFREPRNILGCASQGNGRSFTEDFLGPSSSNRRLPSFTPGFLGTGRATRRRIQ
mmetsp:Transcript_70323/g.139412  ORF Transcript_70323/g.139412 Transcript_70323/m.139412 type:complete len:297 (-) Transcript_70323:146-1036(-)